MAVRRLAAEQPKTFAFNKKNDEWAKKQITKYPEGRQASAVIPLLWQAQKAIRRLVAGSSDPLCRGLSRHGAYPRA